MIPGSNFLGMAAKYYTEYEDSWSFFHSGAVRFGDALPVLDNTLYYKTPLSFFHDKLNEDSLVNHHLVEDFSSLPFKQLKQKRDNYINSAMKELEIHYNYMQKSAYDASARRSKEGSMYGYESIPPEAASWQFTVAYDSTVSKSDIEKLEAALLGEQRLGKSKSAQYGRIRIEKGEKAKTVSCNEVSNAEVYLYAKSRLALVDEEGNASYDLRHLLKGLDDNQIVWEKCQIKTAEFTPYNGAMQSKCYERSVIKNASVIVLKNLSSEQIKSLKKGVGVFLSEGFGEVLINPDFLLKDGVFTLSSNSNKKVKNNKTSVHSELGKFLEAKENQRSTTSTLASEVSQFIRDYSQLYRDIAKSQWGTIRSICSSDNAYEVAIREYISDGKISWTTEQIETLFEKAKNRDFMKQVAMQMPKVKKEK
jgi:hypothetical protein